MGELLSSDGLETSGRGTGWVGPAAPPSDPVATMEAPLYAGAQPNAAGSDRTEGLDECDEWSWSVVEQRRVSYERGAAQAGVQWPVSGKLAGYDGSASVPAVNRRGTEPYARWCERTGEVTPPPTRSEPPLVHSVHQGIQLPTISPHIRIVIPQLLEQLHQRSFSDAVFISTVGLHQANQQVHGFGVLVL